MDILGVLIVVCILFLVLALHAAGLFFILVGLWRLLVSNRIAETTSLKAFREGNVWYRRSSATIDSTTGLVRSGNSPIIQGKKFVLLPLLAGIGIFWLLHTNGALWNPFA